MGKRSLSKKRMKAEKLRKVRWAIRGVVRKTKEEEKEWEEKDE